MKMNDFAALGRNLLDCLPGYRVKGSLIFAEPIGHVLRGIGFDSSSHSKTSFHMHVFFQPLCIPAKHVHFTLGFRLRDVNGYDGWYSDRSNLVADISKAILVNAAPFLESVATVEGAAKTAEAMRSSNSHVQEAAALCRILAGDPTKALSQLQEITGLDRRIAWQNEQATRIDGLIEMLRTDRAVAERKLRIWQSETALALGVSGATAA
ncbi:hypothetical protein ADU59_22535 [Pararhizobium polonicum]|uniref:Uncharacterized protein n=1 Tax=Pararhizobium polonicum TaxID=1612624 RepID=A0A1C7NW68_9HYPH|nr:hypothetical protein [Pararhizobium polonicum]OBZ93243.1 hypothetical protein ADU59_22535 [Pararhizobium polonicum]